MPEKSLFEQLMYEHGNLPYLYNLGVEGRLAVLNADHEAVTVTGHVVIGEIEEGEEYIAAGRSERLGWVQRRNIELEPSTELLELKQFSWFIIDGESKKPWRMEGSPDKSDVGNIWTIRLVREIPQRQRAVGDSIR